MCNYFRREQQVCLFTSEELTMPYFVYILRCKGGSYYTGHAKDVEKRFEMHKKGRGARYTRMHEPKKLVYLEQFDSRSKAMRRERKIKTLSHNKKKQLINVHNDFHVSTEHNEE